MASFPALHTAAHPTDILSAMIASLPPERASALERRLGGDPNRSVVLYLRGNRALIAEGEHILHLAVYNRAAAPAPAPREDPERRKLRFSHLDWRTWRGPPSKECCPICLEKFEAREEIVTLLCKHEFHRECAFMWLKEHDSCPTCRFKTL